ncbi:MAG: threonine synthase, partial [Bacteroidetes bacterium]|nr:threonine synthase [Bacteroidota bacterium]
NNYILELFHGPTLAFKDVGARFMARCLGYFNEGNKEKVCVLVATSGDTGGAVADGFYGVEGVDVVILYPKGRVSAIQEKQLTTFGGNIQAVEVNGSFDDCQAMVKTAFLDKEITSKLKLTSANSINVARWLPQMFYYAFALQELIKQGKKQFVFSVPSGNFGNICAAFMLKKMGLSIKHLIAACNANDVIPQYMKTGILEEKVSVSTISNAMDVALPSNFVRIMELYNGNLDLLKKDLSSYSFSDSETQEMMREIYTKHSYILDPHGAVAMLGSKTYRELNKEALVVALETAHPCKFIDVVEETLHVKTTIPQAVEKILNKEKNSSEIENYTQLKTKLLSLV